MFLNENKLDFSTFDEVRKKAYDLQIDDEGYLFGLVAGDQGYDNTKIKLTDLVGNALAVADDRGRETRQWIDNNDVQCALSLLISVCRRVLQEQLC